MTLAEFLLSRISEDEVVARAAIDPEPRTRKLFDGRELTEVDEGVWNAGPPNGYDECRVEGTFMIIYDEGGHNGEQARHIARHDPARVLAECAAKRRIVELHHSEEGRFVDWCIEDHDDYPCTTVRALAGVYADHADFDSAWELT